jgi:hypothetical protein
MKTGKCVEVTEWQIIKKVRSTYLDLVMYTAGMEHKNDARFQASAAM